MQQYKYNRYKSWFNSVRMFGNLKMKSSIGCCFFVNTRSEVYIPASSALIVTWIFSLKVFFLVQSFVPVITQSDAVISTNQPRLTHGTRLCAGTVTQPRIYSHIVDSMPLSPTTIGSEAKILTLWCHGDISWSQYTDSGAAVLYTPFSLIIQNQSF